MTVKFKENIETLLAELEVLQQQGTYPNIDRATAEYIYDIIIKRRPKLIVEVGAANGYSTIWLGLAAKEVGGKVITFERGPDRFAELKKNINRSGLNDFIESKNEDAIAGLGAISQSIDFAFIDATKSEYLEYFQHIEIKLSAGAIVIADNIISHQAKLQNFIDYAKIKYHDCEIIDIGKGIMVIENK